MKKALALILGIMVHTGIFAQGYPVIDITAIIAAIENGYTLVEQLQAMYNNVRTSYSQLQQQIKNFEAFDLRELDAKDPLGSWRSIMTYADRMMTYEENIETIIKKKNLKIGNASYSLGDIFTNPPNKTIQNMSKDGVKFMTDPFETSLTTHEKAVFHRKYGMSYGNYMRYNHLGEVLKKKAAEVTAYTEALEENLSEDRERLDNISEGLFESESTIQQQQINNATMTTMAQDTKTKARLLGNIAQQLALMSAQAEIEKQAMQDELNMNDIEISEGLMHMLGDMPPSSAYK
ncbi:MAG: hypothetical protein FWD36_03795 [Treponema sp.]|nr:hypothetical protein [Treponema sp.]